MTNARYALNFIIQFLDYAENHRPLPKDNGWFNGIKLLQGVKEIEQLIEKAERSEDDLK